MSQDSKGLKIVVVGRVQGVGFRHFTVKAAQALGVCGWVKNESDGSVQIRAVASSSAMDAFIEKVSRGPSFGRVDSVHLEPLDPIPEFSGFQVRY